MNYIGYDLALQLYLNVVKSWLQDQPSRRKCKFLLIGDVLPIDQSTYGKESSAVSKKGDKISNIIQVPSVLSKCDL